MPKVLQRDIEELESYYHSGDFVGYDCCLETLEATVKQCALYAKLLCESALQGFLLHARGLHALLRRQSMKYSVCPDNRDIHLKPSHWLQSDMVLPYLLHPVREVFRLYR